MAAIAAARGLYFAAMMVLFGSSAFLLGLRKKLPIVAAPRLPRLAVLLLATLPACAWFVLAAEDMAGALTPEALIKTATATLFGQLFLVRLILLLCLIPLPKRRGPWAAALSGAALILPSATSHAAQSSPAGFTAMGAILDGAHLLTAGFWIGGLVVLAALYRRKEPNMLLTLSLFSDWAMIAVLLLVMTGLIDAASILLGARLPAAPYLAVLGAKLALVLVMLGLAAANRFRLMPRGRVAKVARNVSWELGLGLIVVLLAGVLGELSPAR